MFQVNPQMLPIILPLNGFVVYHLYSNHSHTKTI